MKLRCLLIDDEPPALEILQSHISNVNGLEIVASCKNAVEAIDVLHEKQIDLLFLDIKMPGMGGLETMEKIQRIKPESKIIFLTGHGSKEDRDACEKAGASCYLMKPVEIEVLIEELKDAMNS